MVKASGESEVASSIVIGNNNIINIDIFFIGIIFIDIYVIIKKHIKFKILPK